MDLIAADQNRLKIRDMGIDWTPDDQEHRHPYGADPRIQVADERPVIKFQRLGDNEFRVVTNCVEFQKEPFSMGVNQEIMLNLPGPPGNQPHIYIDEYWYI